MGLQREVATRVPAEERSVGLAWHHANLDKSLAAVKRFDIARPGRRLETTRAWRARNPDYKKKYRTKNPEKVKLYQKRSTLKAAYGISLDQYNEMLAEQSGVCAICSSSPGKKALSVDHNHVTGKVRKLLCGPCNTALGLVKEDPEVLRKILAYLEQHAND